MKAFKRMLKYTYKYRYKYLLGLVFLLVVDIIQLIPPKIIGFLTDSISKGTATPNLLLKYIGYIILIAVVASFSRFVWRVLIFGTSRRVEYDMRSKLFRHLQKMSLNFYNKTKTGDLMALATNDLNAVRMALGPGIIMITDSLVLTITTLSVMFSVNVKLTLLCIIPLPFIALLAIKFGSKIQKRFTKVQEAFSKLTDMIQENFSGIRVVKSFVQEEKEYEKFMKENQNNFDQNMKLVKIWGLMFPLVELIASLSYVILVGIGGTFVVYGNISLGDFMSFNIYLGNLIWPMMAIGWVVNLLQRGAASLGRIEEVLYHDVEIYDKNTDENATLNGDILINNLTFSYPNSKVPAISNINLKLKKGQTLGIIGRTGSGKSTLVNLLLHLYNVEDGKIFINGYDINRIPLKTLREGIGFVPQEAFLFSTTVAENINLPQDDFDMEKIISSSKESDIYDNIMDFKDGFETVVGERGVTLSGGQKQRISIARTLIKDPDILIFDDCLSAVDAKTEAEILHNLKELMKDKTSIIISHRISAIRDSDIIIVLDNGKIVESGIHKDLIDKKGFYYDIYEKQLIEEKLQEEV